MLISLRSRSQTEDLVGLLLDCHQRIRTFVRLAEEVGRRTDLRESDVVDACQRCERYFKEALPLHIEDEEKSLLPRLGGLGQGVDGALGTMQAQHLEHTPLLLALLDALRMVQLEPGAEPRREHLRHVAAQLTTEFEKHLSLEEQVIFPAVRHHLSRDAQSLVVQELRARRRPSAKPTAS